MPNEQTIAVATSFVDLVLEHRGWEQISGLPDQEMRVFFDLVEATGLKPEKVAFGWLTGNHLDGLGQTTGRTFEINATCPIMVVGGNDHFHATGWLDWVFQHVTTWAVRKTPRNQLIEWVANQIELSIPLEPIPLTLDGDFLCEPPPEVPIGYLVQHTRDSDRLGAPLVGVHRYCFGDMRRFRATNARDRIVCTRCHMGALFPMSVRTYGELRLAFAKISG